MAECLVINHTTKSLAYLLPMLIPLLTRDAHIYACVCVGFWLMVASNGRVYYTSQWRLILAHYNRIRARLLNSRALLTGTDLSLFPLNEVTLKRWFKNAARRNYITLLLQGRQLPEVAESTAKTLPAREPPHSAVLPQHPVIIVEAEDTTGELFRKLVLTFIDEFHCY